MEKYFCTPELTCKLLEIGFDKECIGASSAMTSGNYSFYILPKPQKQEMISANITVLPLWSQVIEWFDERNLHISITKRKTSWTWSINNNNSVKYVSSRIMALEHAIEACFLKYREITEIVNKVEVVKEGDREEIWIPLKGYEGRYDISNLGRVRIVEGKYSGSIQNGTQCMLSHVGEKIKNFPTKLLVAQHFLDNLENFKNLYHKDGSSFNCEADNLEWSDLTLSEYRASKKSYFKKDRPGLSGYSLREINARSKEFRKDIYNEWS